VEAKMKITISLFAFTLSILLTGCPSKVIKTTSTYDGTTELKLIPTAMGGGNYAQIIWNSKLKDHAIITIGNKTPILSNNGFRVKTDNKEIIFSGIDAISLPKYNEGLHNSVAHIPGYTSYEMRYEMTLPQLYEIFGNRQTRFRVEHTTSYSEGCLCDLIGPDYDHFTQFLTELKNITQQ
jgi:hypothetical protein